MVSKQLYYFETHEIGYFGLQNLRSHAIQPNIKSGKGRCYEKNKAGQGEKSMVGWGVGGSKGSLLR